MFVSLQALTCSSRVIPPNTAVALAFPELPGSGDVPVVLVAGAVPVRQPTFWCSSLRSLTVPGGLPGLLGWGLEAGISLFTAATHDGICSHLWLTEHSCRAVR
jgi:hypothetical protein